MDCLDSKGSDSDGRRLYSIMLYHVLELSIALQVDSI